MATPNVGGHVSIDRNAVERSICGIRQDLLESFGETGASVTKIPIMWPCDISWAGAFGHTSHGICVAIDLSKLLLTSWERNSSALAQAGTSGRGDTYLQFQFGYTLLVYYQLEACFQ